MLREPTFMLLDQINGWRSADDPPAAGLAVGSTLLLAANPNGPLALNSSDGSLGRLRFPRGLALDDQGTPYLLVGGAAPQVLRFDRDRLAFAPLPGIGGRSTQPSPATAPSSRNLRDLHHPTTIAIAGAALYVADDQRVQVFDLNTLALLEVFWLTGETQIDFAASSGTVYILAGSSQRVYCHRPGLSVLETVVDAHTEAGQWRAILASKRSELLLWNGSTLEQYDLHGNRGQQFSDANALRGNFDTPLLFLDYQKRFLVPPLDACAPDRPLETAEPVTPESTAWAHALRQKDSLFFFYADGSRVPINPDPAVIDETERPRLYQNQGEWVSKPLDSKVYQCQWHRIEVDFAALPPGSRVVLSTASAASPQSIIRSAEWSIGCEFVVPPETPDPSKPTREFLVQSDEGQYLSLRIEMSADGFTSPIIRGLTIHYPRDSYVKYLPAAYSFDGESRRFLEKFLSIIQREWDALEQRISDFAILVEPRAVPAGEQLEFLASWLALPLEGTWDEEQKRRMLIAAPQIYAQRGTIQGLRAYLQVYIENMTYLTAEQQGAYPIIIEGYRERDRAVLPAPNLGYGASLWGAGVVRRLQLDVYATEGEVELISTGDPSRDLFHEYAHRFRVFIPAAWVQTEDDQALLRRAIDAEKPAHTAYDLCLVPSGVIVGVQSTLDIDMILDNHPLLRLGRVSGMTSARLDSSQAEANHLAPGLPIR